MAEITKLEFWAQINITRYYYKVNSSKRNLNHYNINICHDSNPIPWDDNLEIHNR